MQRGFVIGDRGLGSAGDTHPAWMMAHAMVGNYLITGASAIGQIHQKGGSRDDAFNIRTNGPWLAVAVADGVGSRPLSRYGATYVVEALTSHLIRQITSSINTIDQYKTQISPKPSSFLNIPSSQSENIKFQPTYIKPSKVQAYIQQVSLSVGLNQWTKHLFDSGMILEDIPSSHYLQAASIGWLLTNDENSAAPIQPITQVDNQNIKSFDSTNQDLENKEQEFTEADLLNIMREAYIKTYLGLRDHSHYLDLDINELSCTGLALLANIETSTAVIGQIGDGAILGLTTQGRVKELVNAPDAGDPQSVYTINRNNFLDYLAIQYIDSCTFKELLAFHVMTDGLSGDLLYSPDIVALEDWAQKVDYNLRHSPTPAQAGTGMLNWLATYQVTGSWDDRTLVVITKMDRPNGRS
jgi:hypothetical protein